MACSGRDECAVHAEVFAREPVLFVGYFEYMDEQLNDRIIHYQAFAVLGEYGGHLYGLIHGKTYEPAK